MLKSVIIDSNEIATAPWIGNLSFGDDVPVTVQSLSSIGDCWLATDDALVIVERKAPMDLLASIADGRLVQQAAAMVGATPWCYILVTGYLGVRNGNIFVAGCETNWNERSVQGALADVQDLGCEIVYCENERAYGSALLWLAGRDHGVKRIKARRQATIQSPQETILCSLPHISEIRAQALMEHHESLAKAIVGLTKLETDEHTPGIGRGTRRGVRTILGLADDEELLIAKGHMVSVEIGDGDGMILADAVGYEAITKLAKMIQELRGQ